MGGFVVLEGIDGSGTTTQVARLVARLAGQGAEVVETREPTDLATGRLIRTVLRGEPDAPHRSALPWLFGADRRDHLVRRIEPALARGAWVVCDRYLPSSLAYQSLEAPLDLVDGLNATFRAPDVLVMLDVPVDVALARVLARGGHREIYEERTALERVVAAYDAALDRLAGRGWPVVRLDGTRSVDDVAAAVAEAVGC